MTFAVWHVTVTGGAEKGDQIPESQPRFLASDIDVTASYSLVLENNHTKNDPHHFNSFPFFFFGSEGNSLAFCVGPCALTCLYAQGWSIRRLQAKSQNFQQHL